MPQIYDMGPTAFLLLRRKACWGFFRPKKSDGFDRLEPANLGTKGQHATPIPPKPLTYLYLLLKLPTREALSPPSTCAFPACTRETLLPLPSLYYIAVGPGTALCLDRKVYDKRIVTNTEKTRKTFITVTARCGLWGIWGAGEISANGGVWLVSPRGRFHGFPGDLPPTSMLNSTVYKDSCD